eukprot:TRINITY_DN13352_c0_g1_i1.p1 TRINITY_DN13352_c0_g1~~TRINITY_DN13352_c0_g1_i1.p1  ORF type:complete len:127 (+),score=12.34 TRINITY_DN13352_c0_g1_i1:99-479(+)
MYSYFLNLVVLSFLILKKRKDRMSLQRLVEFGIQMSLALNHVHLNGYKHSDIAARNFLLTETETESGSVLSQRLCLTDFGLSRPFEFQTINPPALSIRWLAPEVISSQGKLMTIEKRYMDAWRHFF